MTCMLVAHTGLHITLLCTKDYSCSPGKNLDIALRSLKFPSFPGRTHSQASIEAQMLSHIQKPPMIYTAEDFVQNGWCLATTVHGYHSASALEILLQETVGSETAATIYYSSRRSSWEGYPTSFATFRGEPPPALFLVLGKTLRSPIDLFSTPEAHLTYISTSDIRVHWSVV